MADISPAAQATWDAFNSVSDRVGVFEDYGDALAAALEALADQVVPLPRLPYHSCCDVHAAAIRSEILSIAAELRHD